MTGDTPPPPSSLTAAAPRRRGRLPWIAALLGVVIGGIAMYYLLPLVGRWQASSAPVTATAPAAPAPATPAISPAALDGLTARTAALDAQLRTIEQRVAVAEGASRTSAGYARRAEGMLVAFAARRALDRGLALGYVEPQLRDRFGTDQPGAVATVIAASKAPVTLADLREGLTRIGSTLTTGARRDGFATTVWRELSNLVVLRREDTPSPRPDDRLSRARLILDGGNVEGALAEVARMPGAADASSWIDAAKRYIDARNALATLERTAISAPAPDATAAVVPTVPDATNPAGVLPGT